MINSPEERAYKSIALLGVFPRQRLQATRMWGWLDWVTDQHMNFYFHQDNIFWTLIELRWNNKDSVFFLSGGGRFGAWGCGCSCMGMPVCECLSGVFVEERGACLSFKCMFMDKFNMSLVTL